MSSSLWISEHVAQGFLPAIRTWKIAVSDKEQTGQIRPGTRFVRLHTEDACLIRFGGEPALRMGPDSTEWFEVDRSAGYLDIAVMGEPE